MMIMERKSLGFFLLLLIFLASQEMIMPSEAKPWPKLPWIRPGKSKGPLKLPGPCVSDSQCDTWCKKKGLSGGKCGGFIRRCFCTEFVNWLPEMRIIARMQHMVFSRSK